MILLCLLPPIASVIYFLHLQIVGFIFHFFISKKLNDINDICEIKSTVCCLCNSLSLNFYNPYIFKASVEIHARSFKIRFFTSIKRIETQL